jgi:hypothetical protein
MRDLDHPRIAASKRSFDFAGYRVRLEAGHGDLDVPDVVAFIVDAINAKLDGRPFMCLNQHPDGYLCTLDEGHEAEHQAYGDPDRAPIISWDGA